MELQNIKRSNQGSNMKYTWGKGKKYGHSKEKKMNIIPK